jgi:acetyltransferase-like isoleucine patch superfamily enzyme
MNHSFSEQNPSQIGHPRQVPSEDPLAWLSRTATKLRTLWLAWTYPFASFGKGTWAHYSCHVARSAAPYISIGDNVALARDVRLDVSGDHGTDSPILIVEEGCGLQRRGVYSARNRIHLMRNVICSHSVLLMDHVGDAGQPGPDVTGRRQETVGGTIRIEEECWIAFGAAIVCEQGELVIGRHSVVGANSVVRRSIPPYSVVSGNPARIVKQYDFSKGKWVLGCVRPMTGVDGQCPDRAANALSKSGV